MNEQLLIRGDTIRIYGKVTNKLGMEWIDYVGKIVYVNPSKGFVFIKALAHVSQSASETEFITKILSYMDKESRASFRRTQNGLRAIAAEHRRKYD